MTMKVWAIGLAAGLALAGPIRAAEPATLKFAYFAPENEAGYDLVFKPWVEAVNAAAPAALKVVPYAGGALGRALPQQPQMVMDGVADIAWIVTSSSPGRFPDSSILELPGLYKSSAEATLANDRVVRTVPMAGLTSFKVLAGFGSAPLGIYVTSQSCGLAQMKGMKLRVATPSDAGVLTKIGAVPVQIPINEATEALGRRTIDGVVTNPQTLFDWGLNRVASCDYEAGLSSVFLALVMNKAKYEALSPEARAALDSRTGPWLARLYADKMQAYVDKRHAEFAADPKRHVAQPTPEEAARLQEVFKEVREAALARDPKGREILEAIEKAKADVQAGR